MEASCAGTIQKWLSLQDSFTPGWPGRTVEKEKASQLGQAFEKHVHVHCVESKMAQEQQLMTQQAGEGTRRINTGDQRQGGSGVEICGWMYLDKHEMSVFVMQVKGHQRACNMEETLNN